MRGIVVGLYMGSSGLVLKPVSGLLEFCSRSIGGVGEAIRAFGDEVTRVPKTRIRTPRQFIGTGAGTGAGPRCSATTTKEGHDAGSPSRKVEGLTAKRARGTAACALIMQSSLCQTGKLPHCCCSAGHRNAR